MSETGSEIFGKDDRAREPVEAWGHTFELRELSAADVQFIDTRKDNALKIAACVARSAVDLAGDRLFADAELPKVAALGLTALQRLQGIIEKLSGIAETPEESVGNSATTATVEPG